MTELAIRCDAHAHVFVRVAHLPCPSNLIRSAWGWGNIACHSATSESAAAESEFQELAEERAIQIDDFDDQVWCEENTNDVEHTLLSRNGYGYRCCCRCRCCCCCCPIYRRRRRSRQSSLSSSLLSSLPSALVLNHFREFVTSCACMVVEVVVVGLRGAWSVSTPTSCSSDVRVVPILFGRVYTSSFRRGRRHVH